MGANYFRLFYTSGFLGEGIKLLAYAVKTPPGQNQSFKVRPA